MSLAFFHTLLDENVCLDPPAREEDEYGVVWPLKKALYGTRKAALLFQEDVMQAMVSSQ